jgi:hypothetical protein
VQSEKDSADIIPPIGETAFEILWLEEKPAAYYRAAAARARSLRAETTTRRLKDRLGAEIAWYERTAEEIRRAPEPDAQEAKPP